VYDREERAGERAIDAHIACVYVRMEDRHWNDAAFPDTVYVADESVLVAKEHIESSVNTAFWLMLTTPDTLTRLARDAAIVVNAPLLVIITKPPILEIPLNPSTLANASLF